MKNKLLKKDLFGEVWKVTDDGESTILREAQALAALTDMNGVPQLISHDHHTLSRTFISGAPLCESPPENAVYFNVAAKFLRRIHRAGVAHNDLAKEPNILVHDDASPAFIDFQLAWFTSKRGYSPPAETQASLLPGPVDHPRA